VLKKKKEECISTQKTLKISKKSSPKASDTVNGLPQHNRLDLWDRGSISVLEKKKFYWTLRWDNSSALHMVFSVYHPSARDHQ